MTAPQHKSGVPTRDFTDAGTGESFEKSKSHLFATGAHGNHHAAGLLEQPSATAPRPPRNAEDEAAQEGRRPSRPLSPLPICPPFQRRADPPPEPPFCPRQVVPAGLPARPQEMIDGFSDCSGHDARHLGGHARHARQRRLSGNRRRGLHDRGILRNHGDGEQR